MGLFDSFRRKQTRDSIIGSDGTIDDVLLKALLNDEKISRVNALSVPAVSGAVDFISNSIACMPVRLYKEKDGSVEEVTDDIRTKRLNGDTGDTLDGFQMKKAVVEDYLMGKGGYICIQKGRRNMVNALKYVEDTEIVIAKNTDPINKSFHIEVNGKHYNDYEFIKVLRNTKDGASGIGLTDEVSRAIETAYATMKYQLGLVKTGGNKKGFLKTPSKLGTDEMETLKKAFKYLYANNEENVVVLNKGLEFQESSSTSVEMQLNESKQTLQNEIEYIFHIHEDFNQTFKEAIYPIVKAFETALNRDLLLEKEKKNMFFAFDTKEITRVSLVERYNAYKTAKETGFVTLNEIRKEENMNSIAGLDVVNVGLSSVLYDVNTQQYYTPNTNQTNSTGEPVIDEPEKPPSRELDLRIDPHPKRDKKGKFAPKGLLRKIVDNPENLGLYKPEEIKKKLLEEGNVVSPLSQGSLKGVLFENGGGYKVNFGGDGIFQYHPAKNSHHGGAYYKISTGKKGIKRYGLDGKEKKQNRRS